MVKKLNQMVSNRILAVFCFIPLFLGCQDSIKQSKNNTLEPVFKPDTIVNNKLKLNNYSSSEEFYSSINEVNPVDFIRENPVIVFCNISKTEYMLVYQYEGDTRNAFGCFEIGYYDIQMEKYIVSTAYNQFRTESGLHLGLTLNEVEKIKGKNYTRQGNKVRYTIDQKKSPFLQRYNMPEYFMEFELFHEKVVRIKFGFPYL